MAKAIDLATTFIHLSDGGDARSVKVTPAFWRGDSGDHYDRLAGVFDFSSSKDLHSSMQEMHPEADEVLYLVSGAIDVMLEEAEAERTVALESGHAAIVPRGVWHRLVMRRPGRLLFINSREGMQGRPYPRTEGNAPRTSRRN
jgi:mannose-6-phosphate isomerase-like protein (cupin superfamily)